MTDKNVDDDLKPKHKQNKTKASHENSWTSWMEFIARNVSGVQKSEMDYQFLRWLLSAAAHVYDEAIWGTKISDDRNNFVKTFYQI